ncbi:ABC transporter permease [Corynebacterium renale]|uniref:ABC transporter permease n=1 Tax=Corynebacterium renale TaxID=1724 RepID=UPI000DFDC55F|nr:ABC transporter permease [Corynebacterium renale]STC98680.1 ABC transport system, permease [Corynebacterium renale]
MASKNSTMRKVSLRNIAAHKLRLALTVLAVVLGTAFISGAFIFTNTLSKSYESALATSFAGVDVVAKPAEGQAFISPADREAISGDKDVAAANIADSQTVVLGNDKQEAIQAGQVSLSIWYDPQDKVSQPDTIVEGNAPDGADQLVMNKRAADNAGVAVGDRLIVVDPQARHEMTVAGLFEPDFEGGQGTSVKVSEPAYLERYTTDGATQSLFLRAASEREDSDTALRDHLVENYTVDAVTGEVLIEDTSKQMAELLSFVNYFLIGFGLIALLVGTFLIANTFSMIVAQRTKEFALLRALGASRKQITRSVVFESFITGLIGSALGVLAGMGLVAGIKAWLASQNMALPGSGLGLTTASVVVPLVLGTIVTVVSAWLPARRAGEVQPVEAMRSQENSTATSLKGRTIVGVLVLAIGIAAATAGVLMEDSPTGTRATLIGVGAVAVIIGFFLAGPAFSLPIVPTVGRVIGAPFGAVGRLAATNSQRNPRRTATTAFALTLGVALVTVIGMLGTTMKDTASEAIEDTMSADYVLTGPTTGGFPLPAETYERVADAEGVGTATRMWSAPITADSVDSTAMGGVMSLVLDNDPREIYQIDKISGELDLSKPGFIAEDSFAKERGWTVGEEYTVRGVTGQVSVPLLGTYSAGSQGRLYIAADTMREVTPNEAARLSTVAINAVEGADLEQLRTTLEEAVKDLLVVQVLSAPDMAGVATQAIDQMLNILYGLLALAVIIAVLGILNTLTLNVIERRREIGMLRAVGMQRRQVRTMITLEAVQISLFGAVMGIVIGVGLGWAFLKVLAGEGLSQISIPWMEILWIMVGAAIVGVLAAIWPAHRAAKTPALDAIAED